jgi:hypothetical protein
MITCSLNIVKIRLLRMRFWCRKQKRLVSWKAAISSRQRKRIRANWNGEMVEGWKKKISNIEIVKWWKKGKR